MVAGMAETGQSYDEPLHGEEEGHPPGRFGRAQPRGDHPLQMERLPLMDRTSPEAAGRFLECVAVCWGHLARVAAWRSPRRANVCFWMLSLPKKGQRLPQRGLTSPLFSSFMTFLAFNVKNSENFKVSLVGCF
jgi:hypothetical protein